MLYRFLDAYASLVFIMSVTHSLTNQPPDLFRPDKIYKLWFVKFLRFLFTSDLVFLTFISWLYFVNYYRTEELFWKWDQFRKARWRKYCQTPVQSPDFSLWTRSWLYFTPVTTTITRTTTPKYTRRKHPRGFKLGKKPHQTKLKPIPSLH